MKNKEYKQQKLKEFRNKFGGDVWLGADRKVVEDFLSSLIDEILECLPKKEILGKMNNNILTQQDRDLIRQVFNLYCSRFNENLNNKIR
jgi:hypothetical protein